MFWLANDKKTTNTKANRNKSTKSSDSKWWWQWHAFESNLTFEQHGNKFIYTERDKKREKSVWFFSVGLSPYCSIYYEFGHQVGVFDAYERVIWIRNPIHLILFPRIIRQSIRHTIHQEINCNKYIHRKWQGRIMGIN